MNDTETKDCCKEDIMWSEPVTVSVNPRDGKPWFTFEEQILIKEFTEKENLPLDNNGTWAGTITILKTVNPSLAKYVFTNLIANKLNAQFTSGI